MMTHEPSPRFPHLIAACILFIALIDVCTSRLTMPVLYTIPLLLYALSYRRRWLPLLAVAAVALTFATLAIKVRYFPMPGGSKMLGWRLLNRSFAALAISLCAGLLYFWIGFRQTIEGMTAEAEDASSSVDASVFHQLLHSVTLMLATVVGSVLTAVILIADVLSPAPANLPILYAVPLIMVSLWISSRRVLWGLLPFLLIFTVLGYFWGPSSTLSPDRIRGIMMNRAFAAFALIVVAVILHLRMGRKPPQPALGFEVLAARS